jgi:hypothetical protein
MRARDLCMSEKAMVKQVVCWLSQQAAEQRTTSHFGILYA